MACTRSVLIVPGGRVAYQRCESCMAAELRAQAACESCMAGELRAHAACE